MWTIQETELSLQDRLGQGAMGEVVRARWGDMLVAVKLLRGQTRDVDEAVADEFQREVDFLRTIRHPNIVLFHGTGSLASGACR